MTEPSPRRLRVEELDWAETPWGLLALRHRVDPTTGREVYEIKLDEEYLMSSQFTESERALARLGLDACPGAELDVLVAGLGLGYTAEEVRRDPRTSRLTVVEVLAPVVRWHREELFPDTRGLVADPRTEIVEDDFFALVREERWEHPVDVLLVDIDHSPQHHLRADHADFYTREGLGRARRMVRPGGCLALWSDDPPDPGLVTLLGAVFGSADADAVPFANPLTGATSSCTVYVAVHTAG